MHGNNIEPLRHQTQKRDYEIGINDANDNWGVTEYLQNDNFKYVQDYLHRIDHLLTMSDSVKHVAFPSTYETVSTAEELLQKPKKRILKRIKQQFQETDHDANENLVDMDNPVSVNTRETPKPLVNNFIISPTNKSGIHLKEELSASQTEMHCEDFIAKHSEDLELHTHRPRDNRFREFVCSHRNKTEGLKQQTTHSTLQDEITSTIARVKSNQQSIAGSPEEHSIIPDNTISSSNDSIETKLIEMPLKEAIGIKNIETVKTVPLPLSKLETHDLEENLFSYSASDATKTYVMPSLERVRSPAFATIDEKVDIKPNVNHSLTINGHAEKKLQLIAVPKLNLSDINDEAGLNLNAAELKPKVDKPLHAASSELQNKQVKPNFSAQSKKSGLKINQNAFSRRSVAEVHSKRPSSAGKLSKTVNPSAQRKWEKSCIAWSSYGKNELRTWSSVQLPKKKLPEKRLHQSKPFVVTSTTARLLQSFENSLISLPEEVLLHIFSYLSISDLFAVAKVCKTFGRISHDFHLWKLVKVADLKLSDEWFAALGNRSPQILSLTGCSGSEVSNVGLRTFFRRCKTSLTDLHVENCAGSQLSGDAILLHASCHCRNLTHVNVAWSRTTENGIIAIALACTKLLSLNINGNSAIGEEAFEVLTKKHACHLESLEMSGCFGVPSEVVLSLLKATTSLHTLNIGLCSKISTECVIEICSSLTCLKHFDLRGVKSVTNQCLHVITTQCKNLESLIVSNCSQITDVGISEIATYRNSLTHLDISGCSLVSDEGIVGFLMAAKSIVHLDLSGTGATHITVDFIANHNFGTIKTLKLSFCHNITLKCLLDLLNVAVALKSLHLYGCKRIKLSQLMRISKGVLIEK